MSWSDILLNIMLSILSAGVFWCISFKISRTKIIFSDKLIKSNTIKSGGYRIKIANIGKRDLIEMTIVAKLKVIIDDVAQVFFLDISGTGTQSFITLLAGMKSYKKEGRSNFRILTLFYLNQQKKD